MKNIKNFTSKIMAGFLSLAMVITGAMSLGTMKKHTASADDTIGPVEFSYDNVWKFAYDMAINMEFHSDKHGVLLVDNQLFFEANLLENMTYDDVRTEAFFVGFADGINDRFMGGLEPGATEITIEEAVAYVDIEIIVNIYNTTKYVKLDGGEAFNVGTKRSLFSRLSPYNIGDNPFYAAIHNLPRSRFYNMLCDLQSPNPFEIYVFPSQQLTASEDGELVIWGWIGPGMFTQGLRWEELGYYGE